mmetsp:Transcript_22906/g.41589  ORF Transcript_22906/g.41589 Transcript_22906/m.41589 type:complete len:147 (+) Transcript_22906:89-529(+)|eukprot:CAMPEP_0202484482 /NCGR_PEP_ID=MMETSP1361-20130828/3559_1 /ASSEMBLY_ACC=CAM_ASM_000849 /TAXON_ID=210615 /ORGANISM="Staurosira complex sp., Strain CCMP2646" /LENGTH=146 /DNA_ID=CAMNT_0049113141 /DNA_START=60 /DNA_END=500 /DNA_ORIENTATION=+
MTSQFAPEFFTPPPPDGNSPPATIVPSDTDETEPLDPETQELEDDETVIPLDHVQEDDLVDTPEMQERRRNVLRREIQREQRSSCVHVSLLCMIPTAFLIAVIVAVMAGGEECGSEMTTCYQEPRSFMNAFTSRCLCVAVDVNPLD